MPRSSPIAGSTPDFSYRWSLDAQAVLCWVLVFFVSLMVFYPVAVVLLSSFAGGGPGETAGYSLAAWRTAFSDPGILSSIWNTITVTLVRQGIAFPVAIGIAWLLARTDIPGAHWLEFLFWVAFFLPALPATMGWILLLDPDYGLLNRWVSLLPFVDHGPFNIYSFWGIIWAHLATNTIAVKVMLLTPAFRNMDVSLEEASKVCGAGFLATMTRIVIPVMTPVMLVVLLLTIIHSFQSFEQELILGFPFRFYVFSTKIYSLINQDPPLFGAAAALSTVILALMLPFIWLQRRRTSQSDYVTVGSRFKGHRFHLGRWKNPAFIGVLGIALIVTAVPLVFLLLGTFMRRFGFFDLADPWTLLHWQRAVSDPIFLSSLKNTLVLCAAASLFGVITFTLIAYVIMRTHFIARGFLDLTSWLPFSLPGIILGVGLLSVFLGTPLLRPLYGSMFLLVIATVIANMTLGVQIIKSNFAQLDLELEEAARVGGGTWWHAFRHVLLPILTPTLLLVAALSFIAAARNVSTVALLATSRTMPLSLLQLDFMVDFRYETAAVVGFIVVAITTGVAMLARWGGLRMGLGND